MTSALVFPSDPGAPAGHSGISCGSSAAKATAWTSSSEHESWAMSFMGFIFNQTQDAACGQKESGMFLVMRVPIPWLLDGHCFAPCSFSPRPFPRFRPRKKAQVH
jgi:hypothetical protein